MGLDRWMLEMESLKIGGSYFGFVSSIFGKIARNILPNPVFFQGDLPW